MKPLLFVDHFDSFSNNLASQFISKGVELRCVQSAYLPEHIDYKDFEGIVLSPGPGHPQDYKHTQRLIQQSPLGTPIFGVCLGLQLLLYCDGAIIEKASIYPVHGRRRSSGHTCHSRWLGPDVCSGPMVFYNSLECKISHLPKPWRALWHEESVLLAEHSEHPKIGAQFHPESFGSPNGSVLIERFIDFLVCKDPERRS